jgi:nickel-dependent lactate racemase
MREKKREREREREREIEREVENFLESKNLVLIVEDEHKIITFKFT